MSCETAEWYDRAATRDLVGHSAVHVAWAAGIAHDPDVLDLVDRLPRERRQPSLLFSVAALLGAPVGDYGDLRGWLLENWDRIEAEARVRRTQTNDAGRCAPLVAALARVPGPIALLEVGASAGLCLVPERYAYRFGDDPVLGHGAPVIQCRVSGRGVTPGSLPDIVWRRGIDLEPLSILDPDDVRWLDALIPPDRPDRRDRLHAAIRAALPDPPVVVAGDALASLPGVALDRPRDATLVVASLGTLVYLPPADRAAFPAAVARLGGRLVTLEGVAVVADVAARLDQLTAPDPTGFVLALDGEPLAHVAAHGDRLSWLSPAGRPDGVPPSA